MTWAPDYTTAEDLAGYVGMPGPDGNELQLGLAITAASRAVDKATRRQFGQVAAPEARYYTAFYDDVTLRWVVPIDDLMTTTGLSLAYDSAGDLTFASSLDVPLPLPRNAAAKGSAWTELVLANTGTQATAVEGAIRATAQWGWATVPDSIVQATLLQASRFFKRKDAPFGLAGTPQNGGTELRLLAKVDPDVEVVLADYRRPGWVFV
jgi:hypothetical protein